MQCSCDSSGGKNVCYTIAFALIMIGAINWGLVGLGGFLGQDLNVVHLILGAWPTVEWIVYLLVGLSAIYKLAMCKSCCGSCDPTKK